MTIPSVSNGSVEYGGVKAPPATKVLASKESPSQRSVSSIDIIDIRHDAVQINLKDEFMDLVRPENGPKAMPTLILYDERGLQLFEEVIPFAQD